MKIKFGAIVTDGRGKLGGHVFSKNRAGAYMRTKVTPSNPQTSYQQAGRAILTQLSKAWSALTNAQIAAWNAATQNFPRTNEFGDLKELSGKNLFVGVNKNLLQVGEAQIDDPPTPAALIVPDDLTIADTITTTWDITPSVSGAVDHLVIEATGPLSVGTSFFKNRLHKIQVEDAYSTGAIDILASYTARYGAPQSGARVGIAVFSVNNSGQRSPAFTGSVVIA